MALTLLHYGCNSSRNIHTQVTRVHVQLLIYNISVLLPHSISFFIPSAKNEIGNVAYKSFIILIILKTAPSLVSDSNMAIWLLSSFSWVKAAMCDRALSWKRIALWTGPFLLFAERLTLFDQEAGSSTPAFTVCRPNV